jgi:hypothetical protein
MSRIKQLFTNTQNEKKNKKYLFETTNFIITRLLFEAGNSTIKSSYYDVCVYDKSYFLSGVSLCYIMNQLGYNNELCYEKYFKKYETRLDYDFYKYKSESVDKILELLNMQLNPLK